MLADTTPNTKVRLLWYCGNYSAPHDYGTDAPECATEIETTEDLQDYLAGACTARCPRCGAELTQDYDPPHLMEEI